MRSIFAALCLLAASSTFACDREASEALVKSSIEQGLRGDEKVRSLKIGTVNLDEKDRVWAVHAVFELERFGRKTSEQAVMFRLAENCKVESSSGAILKKVQL